MKRKLTVNDQFRNAIGNHTSWQDKKQGSQIVQDYRVKRLANQPGLNSENVNRQNVTQSMVQLMAILSSARIARSAPTTPSNNENSLTTKPTPHSQIENINTLQSKSNSTNNIHQSLPINPNLSPPPITSNFKKFTSPLPKSNFYSETKEIVIEIHPDEITGELFSEQVWLLDSFLKNKLESPLLNSPLSRVNNLVDYILEKDSDTRFIDVAKTLLKADAAYGSEEEEIISVEQSLYIISTYLNQEILGMSIEEWCIKNEEGLLVNEEVHLTHQELKNYFEEYLKKTQKGVQLSSAAYTFYWNIVLANQLPTLTMQLDTAGSDELSQIIVTGPRWGFIHAGAMFLNDHNIDFNNYRLEEIENVGMLQHAALTEGLVPESYIKYFKLPSLVIYAKKNKVDVSSISKYYMRQIIIHYFKHIEHWQNNKNPIKKFIHLSYEWKTRSELSRQLFKRNNIPYEFVESYLNKHGKWEYSHSNVKLTLPNIDSVFDDQNKNIANVKYELDKLILSVLFEKLTDADKDFFARAKVDRVRIQFNSMESIKRIPLSIQMRKGISQSEGLIYHVPDSIDLLACMLNDKEYIYAILIDEKNSNYKLKRVDRDRLNLGMLIKNTAPISDPEYKIKVTSHLNLKKEDETLQIMIENLCQYNKNKLLKVLHDKGYDKTLREEIKDVLLSLIPFYSCITGTIKHDDAAAVSCILDVASLIPFLGQASWVATRFGSAMARSGLIALRYGMQQSTVKGLLAQTSRQFLTRFPLITQEISPQVVKSLGKGLARGLDPGFEPMVRGLGAMINILYKLPKHSVLIKSLIETLNKEKSLLDVYKSQKNINFVSYYSSDYGKNLDVTELIDKNGNRFWVQLNKETGDFFGPKFLLNSKGNLERIPIDINHRNKGSSSDASSSRKGSLSSTFHDDIYIDRIKSITKTVVRKKITQTNYFQYMTSTPFKKEPSEILVVTAHGGFTHSDTLAPAVIMPSDITIKFLTPHRTMLLDPGLSDIVNAGDDLKAYVTLKNGAVVDTKFEPQNNNPSWLFDQTFDPSDPINTLGHKNGLQNYRHFRFDEDSDSVIADVIMQNRKLAAKGQATLTDVLAVSRNINFLGDTSLEAASVQKVLDMNRDGLLRNEIGKGYKTIIFSHCRNCFQDLDSRTSIYVMKENILERFMNTNKFKSKRSVDIQLTILNRDNVWQDFHIRNYALGRFIFIPINAQIQRPMNLTT